MPDKSDRPETTGTDARVTAVARAIWRLDCRRGDAEYRSARRQPPEKWADPWEPCGIRQRLSYEREARALIADIAGLAND